MHHLFLSCLKATELMEKKLHFKLSGKEELQLKVHKMMCKGCSNYEKHNLLLEKGIEHLQKNSLQEVDLGELKERITKVLNGKTTL